MALHAFPDEYTDETRCKCGKVSIADVKRAWKNSGIKVPVKVEDCEWPFEERFNHDKRFMGPDDYHNKSMVTGK